MKTNTPLEAKLKHYRLSSAEYEKACGLLGRDLKEIEWPLFSALWSEHCSYKSSKIHLRKFYNKNATVLEAEGENAGVVDLGQGERVAFKMESHNHPSFIEPYQGAATGVGGILRDIFTMGARPIALADYLCFGEPKAARMEALVDGVVRGIAGYGNCVGVPTVTGQTHFHGSYDTNILVNAMAVGLFRKGEKIALSKAKGVGNLIVYVGAKTGKDGVHGASMASESFDHDSEKKKPNVQIGDPYFEKLLIESCLEVIQKDLVVAIQDMGAAGLTSSSFEMASKGQIGMEMHLDKVPLRDSTITPEEILLSESQERMLMVVEPNQFAAIQDVFAHWGLDAAVIGHVLSEKVVRLLWQGETLTEINPDLLVEEAPKYDRPYKAWDWKNRRGKDQLNFSPSDFEQTESKTKGLWGVPQEMSRRFITKQYDQRVGLKTVCDTEFPVALMKLPDSGRGLGLVLGCRPEVMRLDAKLGAFDSIAYPALQMACQGIRPMAITDCLNFGNPEKIEIMSEFVASVEAISEMAQALDAPVVSGNVSFYNETLGKNITSTPATGLVGLRSTISNLKSSYFEAEGHSVYVVDLPLIQHSDLWGQKPEWAGEWNTAMVTEFIRATRSLSEQDGVQSLRVVTSRGLLSTLMKMSQNGFGVIADSVFLDKSSDPAGLGIRESGLFYQLIVAGPALNLGTLEECFSSATFKNQIQIRRVGVTKAGEMNYGDHVYKVDQLKAEHQKAWENCFANLTM